MNKPIRLSTKTHKILFCSDLHMNHTPSWPDTPPLWKSRGFASIEEHDSWVRDHWMAECNEQTIIFDLGDRMFSDPKGERFRQTTLWPGDQRLINGNHWSGQKQIYQDGLTNEFITAGGHVPQGYVYPLRVNNLTYMGDVLECYIDGIPVFMMHRAPYLWPEIGDGGYALCGHSHGRCKELNPDDQTQGRILDVGVDNAKAANGTPFFSWHEIKDIMARKPVVKRDHH